MLVELGSITRLVDLDKVLVAGVEEVEDFALCLITRLDAVLVEQLRHLNAEVHVEELTEILVAERLDHLPCVVFRSRQLEQLHLLWSAHQRGKRISEGERATYLQTMSVKFPVTFINYNNSSHGPI